MDGHRGDVVDIQLLRTTMLEVGNWMDSDEATGRIVIIPNSFIFKSQVFNYSHIHPFIWGKVDVLLTFESPAREAQEMLLRILGEETRQEFAEASRAATSLERRYGMADAVYAPRVTTSIQDSGVMYHLFYVCHFRKDDETRDRISKRILRELELDPRFRIAYPTQREVGDSAPVSYQKGQHE